MKTKNKYTFLTYITWMVILCVWFLLTNRESVSSSLFPSPSQVWQAFVMIMTEGYNGTSFWKHAGISLYRLSLSCLLALVTAIPLGLLSGYFKAFRAIIDSIVQFYRPLPPLAYYTLLILWLGIDESSKVTLLFLAAFSPIYLACVSAVGSINPDYIYNAESLGASKKAVFFTVVLPSCLPNIFTGLRTAVGVAYTTLVSAEMIAATSGIGWMVIDASRYLKSDVMFVGIIIMGITGILLDMMLRLLENHFVFWKGKED
ncbi:taurine ABC transporter permease [Vagococcus penaei]|uniref:Taurine ABC transporter permease n=1 Tax=Vagococcus penaei TaxID=633807 RepID=A0A1Q2D369_9ENTE|nr:ABC transporter permease [Vagococcus penaei]AQP52803.1 taurine ABC transporter permease [Vagococcus penaei]RSU01144.1 taurine ABC transporter permease [Vagococcus penaei]